MGPKKDFAYIARIRVEEGFLDGLDLELRPGLNVLIGPRGSGKSSVLELVRFALAAPTVNAETNKRALEHALGVLGTGQVEVTLRKGDSEFSFIRTAREREPRTTERSIQKPIILSQSEIESIGLNHEARLRIVDGFIGSRATLDLESARSGLHSVGADIAAAMSASSATTLDSEDKIASELAAKITQAEERIRKTKQDSTRLNLQRKQLDLLTNLLSQATTRIEHLDNTIEELTRLANKLEEVHTQAVLPGQWTEESPDPLGADREKLASIVLNIERQSALATQLLESVRSRKKAEEKARVETEGRTRKLRQDLERSEKGLGEIARQLVALREQRAQFDLAKTRKTEAEKRLKMLRQRRDHLLETVEAYREELFRARKQAADRLSQALGGTIKVNIEQAASLEEYTNTIAGSLKGSGLRYNEIAAIVARTMSPAELISAIETNDTNFVTSATELSSERVERILTELRRANTGAIAAARIDDRASFQLLDGGRFRSIETLSTGQRCTVVLPIIMEHLDRVIILDQPEDHIDNGFITATLIAALRNRGATCQTIVATHNANIPVLGEASLIVSMRSDGNQGHISSSEHLEHAKSIKAITDVMEGGREAFERRSVFYHSKQQP